MTRNGKIARLPAAIREELNQRLLEGEPASPLVQWLNGLPQVQALLQAKFQGKPITENNLSNWKMGGFAAWEAGERMADKVSAIMAGTTALQSAAKGGLTDRMALMFAANMAIEMQRLESAPDGIEKAKIWRELRIGLLALRRSELYAERLKIEHIKHPEPEKPKKDPCAGLSPRERIMQKLGIGEGYDGLKNPELTRPPYQRSIPIQVTPGESK
jgi:hypothetical protein